jgi:hypothetical protein
MNKIEFLVAKLGSRRAFLMNKIEFLVAKNFTQENCDSCVLPPDFEALTCGRYHHDQLMRDKPRVTHSRRSRSCFWSSFTGHENWAGKQSTAGLTGRARLG